MVLKHLTKRLDKHGTRSINHFNNLMQLSRNMSPYLTPKAA